MSNEFEVSTVRCAGPGCEHVRKWSNHWFVIRRDDFQFICEPLRADTKTVRLFKLADDQLPVCGSACAQKLFELFLSGGK